MHPESGPEIDPETAPVLPGLELPQDNRGQTGPNTEAVARVVARLNSSGSLTADHDDFVQAALTLAAHVDRLPANAKAYAVSNLLGQYLDALKALHPAPGERDLESGTDGGVLATALDKLLDAE